MSRKGNFLSIVRGGQITIHYVRMAKQVLKAYLITTLILLALVFSAIFVYQTDYKKRGYAFDYFVSYNFILYTKKSYEIPVNVGNEYKGIEMRNIVANSFMRKNYYEIKSTFNKAALYSLSVFFFSGLFVFFYIRRRGINQMEKELIRGNKIVDSKELGLLINKYIKISKDKFEQYGLIKLCGVKIPNTFEVTNVLVAGDQGVKKSQVLIENLKVFRSSGKKAIIYDPSGDMIRAFYREDKDYILNPLDERGCGWNIWNECKREYQLHSIANSFIADDGNGKRTDFFVMAARIVFISLVKKSSNLEDLDILVKKLTIDDLAIFLRGTDAGVIIDTHGAKAAHSVRAVLLSNINSIFYTDKSKRDLFCITDWVKEDDEDSFLFISCPPNQLRMLKPLISVWIDIGLMAILSMEPSRSRRIGTFIDEFASLNKIDSLADFLAQARKYGNISFLGFQNISQLIERYGQSGAKEITGLCGNWLVFRTNEFDNAKWISDNLYTEDVVEKNENTSFGSNSIRDGVSINENRHVRNLVTPTEIQSLQDGFAYLRVGRGFPIAKVEQIYQDIDHIAIGFIENETDLIFNNDPILQEQENDEIEYSENGNNGKKKKEDKNPVDFTDIDLNF